MRRLLHHPVFPIVFGVVATIALVGVWLWWAIAGVEWFAKLRQGSDGTLTIEQLGQTGDLFGGISALFAALAFMGVAIGAYYQNKTWRIAERQHVQQSFEPLFFQLLTLHRQIDSELILRRPHDSGESEQIDLGVAAEMVRDDVSYFWSELVKDPSGNKEFAHAAYDKLYSRNESTLGPYFRSLYHLFALVDRSRLPEADKHQYAHIARALLSADVLFLLLINCLTERGLGLKRLVERYGLLKHIKRLDDSGGPTHEALLVEWYFDLTATASLD